MNDRHDIQKPVEDKIQELSRQIEELRSAQHIAKIATLPMAIVVASILVAGSVTYASLQYRNGNMAAVRNPAAAADTAKEAANIRAVSADDHIFGDYNAPVKIVEYSDTECPFCKRFHQTMRRIMVTYGADGRVAWVYRHLPLIQLHSQAPLEAHATECSDAIGGNDAFWKYINRLFEITPSNNGLDLAQLPVIAKDIGLDAVTFDACMKSDQRVDRIVNGAKEATDAGIQSTPYSIVFSPKGKRFVINGAQSYETVRDTIEQALKN